MLKKRNKKNKANSITKRLTIKIVLLFLNLGLNAIIAVNKPKFTNKETGKTNNPKPIAPPLVNKILNVNGR